MKRQPTDIEALAGGLPEDFDVDEFMAETRQSITTARREERKRCARELEKLSDEAASQWIMFKSGVLLDAANHIRNLPDAEEEA